MQTEDRQIIHQCLNGDAAMFGFLVEKYKEGVYALAYSRLGNFHDAQDIAHLLGISIRTVAERLRVGRERLREEMVNMMSATLKEQRLPAGFTFRIVEMVKKISINPITQSKGLPWGLSLATGVIITIFCLNPFMSYFSQMDTPAGAPLVFNLLTCSICIKIYLDVIKNQPRFELCQPANQSGNLCRA